MNKFSVKQTTAGYSFNLTADNGQIVATSQVYASKDACLNGIESVRLNANSADIAMEAPCSDRADQIIRNAKIFTSDKANPLAMALVVKDGKFV